MRSTVRNLRRLAAAAALFLPAMLVAACDEEEGADRNAAESAGATPTPIVYQVRGVYPPFLHRVVIDSDGRATITVRSALKPERTRHRTVELPEGRLARIRRELASADLGSIDDRAPRMCSDCPEYTVEFGGERVELFAVNVPDRLRPAVRPLKQALKRASRSPGERGP